VRKADNLPLSSAVVTKSGNLNFLEPSGPVTGLLYLFYSENLVVKYILETGDVIFYNRYFDDILKIFDCRKITTDEILHFINNIHERLQFTLTCDEIEKNNISAYINF